MSKTQQVDKSQVFEKETQILSHSRNVLTQPAEELTLDTLRGEYEKLSQSYAQLLGEAKLLTSVSDRLQSRLDKANDNVNRKETELNIALTSLEKSKNSMTITNIIFMFIVGLFLVIDWTVDAVQLVDEEAITKIADKAIEMSKTEEKEIAPMLNSKISSYFQEEQTIEIITKLIIVILIIPLKIFLGNMLQKLSTKKKQSVAILE
ncbi:hypothetical protein [Thermoflexibacter ruber]|uniref:Uncharacterized protein n=1 Tax=Thermoflexibacter ruber TaxID=1003 RepID=A0A1I2CQ36_9BACT|nr:hypothetical protein [Thermoflexibacter ruber]SFE70489.1 hypothetical protein SAMN04488541_1005110 [Thermoflexibacter ruber]